ncbi:MAG: hypothetical protein J6Z47_04075 [Bacteroidales bacterium]|nr:hypothetical protein [Bacteroidales bacterium]
MDSVLLVFSVFISLIISVARASRLPERNTRFEPEAAPRTISRLPRYPRLPLEGCPSGA